MNGIKLMFIIWTFYNPILIYVWISLFLILILFLHIIWIIIKCIIVILLWYNHIIKLFFNKKDIIFSFLSGICLQEDTNLYGHIVIILEHYWFLSTIEYNNWYQCYSLSLNIVFGSFLSSITDICIKRVRYVLPDENFF